MELFLLVEWNAMAWGKCPPEMFWHLPSALQHPSSASLWKVGNPHRFPCLCEFTLRIHVQVEKAP